MQVVKPDPQRQLPSADLGATATEVQAHLIRHFQLGEKPVFDFRSESNRSQVPHATQKFIDYQAELGESGIAPGGDLTLSDVLDWGKWRKKVPAGEMVPPPKLLCLTLTTAGVPLLAPRNCMGRANAGGRCWGLCGSTGRGADLMGGFIGECGAERRFSEIRRTFPPRHVDEELAG